MTTTVNQASFNCSNVSEILLEPYPYAAAIVESIFFQTVAFSAQEQFNVCSFVSELAQRVFSLALVGVLTIPLINVVALRALRLFDVGYVREETLPNEDDATYLAMKNRGEILLPQDAAPLPSATQAEYSQRKQAVIDFVTHPPDPAMRDLAYYQCAPAVSAFNLDVALQRYSKNYDPTQIDELLGYAGVGFLKRVRLMRSLASYSRGSRPLDATIRDYLSQLYDFLVQKKALFQNHPKENLFKAEIRDICNKIEDAHQNCVDQVASQVEMLMVETVAGFEAASAREAQTREGTLQFLAAYHLFKHKLNLIKEICVKEYPLERHMADLERAAKQKLADILGLNGQIFDVGAHYNIIRDIDMKASNVANIFFEGCPLEIYEGVRVNLRRADRNYAADQYLPEEFFEEGLKTFDGSLRTLRNEIMIWMRSYFNMEAEDEQTRQFIQAISEDAVFTADEGGNLTETALLYLLNRLTIFRAA